MRDKKICESCGLYKGCRSPFMESAGSKNPIILIVGEAPGEDEDAAGIPFVGKAGKLMRNVVTELGLDLKKDVRFTNVVRCRPPQNKITKRAIEFCSKFALQDIQDYDPAMVFIMGNSPLSGILGQSGISNWNGSIIEKDNRLFVPLYHPAYLLRNPQPMDEWLSAMLSACDRLSSDNTNAATSNIKYFYPMTLKEVEDMRDYLDGYEYISYDTEVRYLDAFNKDNLLVSVSFAAGDRAYAVPIDHPESPWAPAKLSTTNSKVRNVIREILESHDHKIIGHNVKFDQLQTATMLPHWFEAGGDTFLISYLLDCRQGIHGLKRLAGIYLNMFEYDSELELYKREHPKEADPKKGGSYENIPWEILKVYGAKDAAATLLLDEKLYKLLSKKQKKLYDGLIVEMSNFLAHVEHNGFSVDENISHRYLKIYRSLRKDIYDNIILKDRLVERLIKSHNRISNDIYKEKLAEREAQKSYMGGKRVPMPRPPKPFVFNPGSSAHMVELVYKFGGMKVVEVTQKGTPSTKSTTLKRYEEDLQILPTIRYYKLLSKMISTYLLPAVDGSWISTLDGKVRSSFNMARTKTGRLSSSDPNLQNIPTKEKEPGTLLEYLPVKNVFTTSFGEDGIILTADQSGMELRSFAALSKCEPMLEIHRSGKDFHKMVASNVTKIAYDDVPKPVRYKFKKVNWTLIYGGSAHTLAHLDGFPVDEAEDIVDAYFEQFPEVPEYLEQCVEFAEDHNYIESPFGRREHLYYINDSYQQKLQRADRRAAVNMPVQSSSSDLVMCGGIILNKELMKGGYRARIVNTVHDSIVIDLPKSELDAVAMLTKYCMENVVDLAKVYFPRIDFSWFNCPLHVDLECGTHYGAQKEYKLNERDFQKFRLATETSIHKSIPAAFGVRASIAA